MALISMQDPETTERIIAPIYGERTEVREMMDRFKAGLPNAKNAPEMGLRALAMAALAHDLDPWIGEIWLVHDEKKNETWLQAGIKGLRKGAKRQLEARHYMSPRFETVPPEEWHKYAAEKDAFGRAIERISLCYLRRTDATERYIEQLDKLFKISGSYDAAREELGSPPVYIGIGVVRVGEQSRMERGQLVNKRAESDAIKRGFDLPFADRVNGGAVIGSIEEEPVDADVIDGTATEAQETETKTEPPSSDDSKQETEPESKSEPEKPIEATEPAQSEKKTKPEAEPAKAEEQPTAAQEKPQKPEPARPAAPAVKSQAATPKTKAEKDKGRANTIEALRRSSPPASLVVACEWIHKHLGVDLQPGKLSFELQKKLGDDYELSNPLSPKVWAATIDLAAAAKGA